MARKSRGKKTSSVKKGGQKARSSKKGAASRQKSEKVTRDARTDAERNMFSFWMNFQEDMGRQVSKVIETQQQFHKDLNKRWSEMSDDIMKRLNVDLPADKQVAELQTMWEKYMKDMNRNLESFLASETEAFDALYARWKPLSEDMNKAIMALGTSKDLKGAQQKLLDSWLRITQAITDQMAQSAKFSSREIKGMRTAWSNLMGDMESFTRKYQESNPEMADTVKRWSDASKRINDLFLAQMDTDMTEVVRRQDFWVHTMSDMSTGFVKAMWETNMRLLEGGIPGPKRRR